MKEHSKMNKTAWFSLAFIALSISAGLYFSYDKRTTLAECHEIVPGIVTDKYRILKKGTYARYEYQIDGTTYERSESLVGKQIGMAPLGGEVRVKVGCARRGIAAIDFGEE